MNTVIPSLKSTLFFIGAVIILCYYAFYNNYPLLYPDTGTYIYSGFEKFVPMDRPITYGLFLRHISLGEILWLPILAQAIILEYVLVLTISIHLPNYSPFKTSFFISAILAFSTGLSFHVSQVIPDIFTPILVLSFCYLLTENTNNRIHKITVSLILILSIILHNSHLFLSLLLILSVSILFILKKHFSSIKTKKLILPWTLILLCWILLPLINYLYDGNFKISKGSHVFIMARMQDNGILQEFLNDNCEQRNYNICNYKDDEFYNLIWDSKSSLYKTGGWEANKEEYNSIIWETLLTPNYFLMHLHKELEGIFSQLVEFDTGDAPKLTPSDPAMQAVKVHFGTEYNQLFFSKQIQGQLTFKELNKWQSIFVLFSGLMIIFVLTTKSLRQKISSKLKFFTIIMLLTLFLNAATVVFFACVVARYESRIIWLLPFTGILYLFQLIEVNKIKSTIGSYLKNGRSVSE